MAPLWSKILLRGIYNYYRDYPLCASIEVTHVCTAACKHCDKGGDTPGEKRVSPEEYIRRYQEIGSPPYLQISGGEPLTRPDVYDVIKAIRKSNSPLPVIIFVTNASLLEVDKYQKLKQAGVDRISISLDFPDGRHNQFRRCPGLFQHLSEVVPRIANNGNACDIAMNTAITKENFRYVVDIARKTQEWGVGVSYSAYTPLRTGDEGLMLTGEDVEELDKLVDTLIELQAKGMNILNPPSLLKKTVQYFKEGQIPRCGAGRKFVVIRPDGMLNPCSLFPQAQYHSFAAVQEFVQQNQCEKCYVAIRAYSEQTVVEYLKAGPRLIKATMTATN